MPYNSFPNAELEELFGRAYALSNPAPELSELFRAHPTYHTLTDLLDYYIDVVHKDPYRANELAFWMVCLPASRDLPNIGYDCFGAVFNRALADRHWHRWGFDWNKDTETFGPTNKYLITSLLSALSIKNMLTDCSDQYATIEDGLNVVDKNLPMSEVLVIGACIQLLIVGSEIVPTKRWMKWKPNLKLKNP